MDTEYSIKYMHWSVIDFGKVYFKQPHNVWPTCPIVEIFNFSRPFLVVSKSFNDGKNNLDHFLENLDYTKYGRLRPRPYQVK